MEVVVKLPQGGCQIILCKLAFLHCFSGCMSTSLKVLSISPMPFQSFVISPSFHPFWILKSSSGASGSVGFFFHTDTETPSVVESVHISFHLCLELRNGCAATFSEAYSMFERHHEKLWESQAGWEKITGIIITFLICVHMKATNTVFQQTGALQEKASAPIQIKMDDHLLCLPLCLEIRAKISRTWELSNQSRWHHMGARMCSVVIGGVLECQNGAHAHVSAIIIFTYLKKHQCLSLACIVSKMITCRNPPPREEMKRFALVFF